MGIVKYKNPTEYSFYVWMKMYAGSTYPADTERFLTFVKTVCAFNAKRWKDLSFLKQRILKEKPKFDPEGLQELLILYEYLIEFNDAVALPRVWRFEKVEVGDGNYLERGIKNGKFYESEKPMP